MCGSYEDSNEIVSKNSNASTRRTFAILVLFSVTLSSLGISCFALLTVQKLSNDLDALRLVLRKSRAEPTKRHAYDVDNTQRAALAVGPIYETPSDVKTATIHDLHRLKRSLDAEEFETKPQNFHIPFGGNFDSRSENFKKISPISFENIQLPPYSKKTAGPPNKENKIVESGTANSEVEFTREFQSDKRKNFDISFKTSIQKNGTDMPAVGNVKLISNIADIQGTVNNYAGSPEIPNPLKKDVESFLPMPVKNKVTEKHNIHRIFPLPQNPEIPSIIGEQQNQMDHHIEKKAVNYDDDVESFTPEYNDFRRRGRGRSNGNQLEIIDEFSPQAGRLKSLKAVHINGDTSQYMLGIHTNYRGNGHLRHAQKTYLDWKMSDWVETIGADRSFYLKNGVLTVKESGLYLVYAQISYLDEHDSNGYLVQRNSENILQCRVTAPSSERLLKGNTCYTAGVVYLDENDRISIDDISDGRFTLFVPGYSFFGMIKLGDVKGK